jgi:hypothetical protein
MPASGYDIYGNPIDDPMNITGHTISEAFNPQDARDAAGTQLVNAGVGQVGDSGYDALMAQLGGATGTPAPPSTFQLDPYDRAAGRTTSQVGYARPNVAYNMQAANQNRGQILDALQLMQQRALDPAMSVAGAHGQLAQAANARGALNAMAGAGRNGGQIAAQSLANGGQMAGDIANARMQEYLKSVGAVGAGQNQLRGADIQNFNNQSKVGLANNQLVNQRKASALIMAANLRQARNQALLEHFKLLQQLGQQNQKNAQGGLQQAGQVGAAVVGGIPA